MNSFLRKGNVTKKNMIGALLPFLLFLINIQKADAQLIFSGEGVNWVGQINGYAEPTNLASDYRVLTYRKVNTTTSNPSDPRHAATIRS